MKLKFKLITPERLVFEQTVDQVTLPIVDGEVTILPNHEFYIGALKPGEILSRNESGESSFAVSGGFVEFSNNTLSVLADTAEAAEEIDLARAQEARQRAEDLAKERRVDAEDFTRTAALLEKELARIRVARKHRSRSGMRLDQD